MTQKVYDQREALYAADSASFGRGQTSEPPKIKSDADFRRERCEGCFRLNLAFGRGACTLGLPYPAKRHDCLEYMPTRQVTSLDGTTKTPCPEDLADEYERLHAQLSDLGRRAQLRKHPA